MKEDKVTSNVSRQSFWSECDTEEKLERMRQEVKRLQSQISGQWEQIRRLQSHAHLDGELVVPIEDRTTRSGDHTKNPGKKDEVYF